MKNQLSFEEQRNVESFLEKRLSTGYFNGFSFEAEKTDEVGHSHGPGVQREVSNLLSEIFDVTYSTKNGKKLTRALADCLLDGQINSIKFGVCEKGQPNLGSMKRILDEVVNKGNNTLYVTWVNFNLTENKLKVWFVNILDFVDCLTWNAGTGQVMIDKSKMTKKYKEYLDGKRSAMDLGQVQEHLKTLYRDGMERHLALKRKQMEKMLKMFDNKAS